MKKKLVFITFVLLITSIAFAQTEADFTVRLAEDGQSAIITGYKGKAANVRIPATIQGLPVREIDGAFYSRPDITGVVIPRGVTRIGDDAFTTARGPLKLKSVTLPEGLLEIGNNAFSGCPITAITLPQSLTSLGAGAFSGAAITRLTLPPDIRGGAYAFSGCEKLKTVVVPEGITKIPEGMFEDCTALSSVTLANSITTIEEAAFYGCTALAAITLPQHLTFLGAGVFIGTAIKTITLPPSLVEFGMTNYKPAGWSREIVFNAAFLGCKNLKTVIVSEGITKIPAGMFFDCTALTSITLADSITIIEDAAFWKCTALTTITLSASLTWIGWSAFSRCEVLTTVTIPDSIDIITFQSGVFSSNKLSLATQAALKRVGYTGRETGGGPGQRL
ncbi:MAG: leucine-rich repeat domain-containing protein [Treponema sp.]|nr:leucine-rich repeat domain-containing protein [Treponema sp.]